MPKDNETIHLAFDGPVTPSEPQGFKAEEMIPCDECLRINPPTRFSCLYCEAPLPLTESTAQFRKPTLRQPEQHEIGFNCICLSNDRAELNSESITKAAELLKLTAESVEKIINLPAPMPLARTANMAEAELVCERLRELGVETKIISDDDLGRQEEFVQRPKSMQIGDTSFVVTQPGGQNPIEIAWSDLCLIVMGRLSIKSVEIKERLTRRAEHEILDASQFFSDEAVIDIYSSANDQTWRIGSNSFDFSCLQRAKSLVASENLEKLRALISGKCPDLKCDNRYKELRSTLEFVWPVKQETHSRGWRRERPGRFSIEAANIMSNETQFTRYSRLCRYFVSLKRAR